MSSDLHSKSGYYATNTSGKTKTKRRNQQRVSRGARYNAKDSSSESGGDREINQWNSVGRQGRHRGTPQPQPRSKSKGRSEKSPPLQVAPSTGEVMVQHISGEDYYYTADKNTRRKSNSNQRRSSQESNGASLNKDSISTLHSMQPVNHQHRRSSTEPNDLQQNEWSPDTSSVQENDYSQSSLSELRMKAVQMEKAMRWWSECTANWREKWTKARAERNAARNEVKQLRENLSDALQESGSLKAEKAALEDVVHSVRSELEELKADVSSNAGTETASYKGSSELHDNQHDERFGKHSKSFYNDNFKDDKMMTQRLTGLQMKLDESTKTIQAERDSKAVLNKSIENLETELSSLRQKYEELKSSKQDIVKQLVRVREANKTELDRVNQKLEEELEANGEADKKLQELRAELERLQEENTMEWGKRERLETEKLQLERESKRLRSQCDELRETVSRRQKAAATTYENELREAQDELQEFRKDHAELLHMYSKQEKVIEERATEYSHCRRRAEQHEGEVRSLRARVEEIKKQQTATEDELDSTQNQVRKQARMMEEKEEEIDKLQIQLDNLYTKMRRQAGTPTPQTYGNRLRAAPTRSVNDELSSSDGSSGQED